METVTKKMRAEEPHQHQETAIDQWKKEAEETQTNLEARLKTQEYKEMLRQLKKKRSHSGEA